MTPYERTKEWRKNNPAKRLDQDRRYRAAHPDKVAAHSKKWRESEVGRDKHKENYANWHEKNARKRRNDKLKHRYGITIEQYEAMLKKQRNSCAICHQSSPRNLHVDHCHSTNAVRGLLCNGCNRILGFANDTPSTLRSAARYLERKR